MAVLVAAAGMLSAAGVSVALEAKANVWGQTVDPAASTKSEGFNIVQGDDYLAQLMIAYDADMGGGYIRFRSGEVKPNNIWSAGKSIGLDRWNMYVKPAGWVKFTLSNAAYEVFAESINWEPIFGAGLFETTSPHAILELFPVSGLTIMGGFAAEAKDGTVGMTDSPFSAFEGSVKYDISGVGSVALEFSNGSKNISGWGMNGDAKRIGAQFNYTGVDKLSVLVGYTGIFVSGDLFNTTNESLRLADKTELSSLAQNRAELFITYTGIDKLSLALYEAALLRGAGWGDFGNRLALKATYQATSQLSFWTRFNLFINYGGNNQAWGGYQLMNSSDKNQKGVRAELYCNYDFGKGIGAYVGVRLDKDISTDTAKVADEYSTGYQIPVGITVNY